MHSHTCNQQEETTDHKIPTTWTYIGEREKTIKYLGVTISQDLRWNSHIDNVTTKANKSLGFIRRNMRGCKPSVKDVAYKAIVRPTLEYAATVWDPYTNQHINSIEMVQRRAARFVANNYHDYSPGTITNILEKQQWETLQARRSKARLTMMFKILHGEVDIPSNQYITSGDSRARGAHRLREIPSSKDVYKFSFFQGQYDSGITNHRRPPQQNQWRDSRSCWAGCRRITGPYSEPQRISRFYPIFIFLIVNTEDFNRHSHAPELKMFIDEPSSVTERRKKTKNVCVSRNYGIVSHNYEMCL